ncbi:hypothetical protein B0H17DRAFT_1146828 [Mycena rosella]|uniref:Uncharacterized protein n=1 Tax=Mycena rosella TaxID=1033263 RepID=A0AAD7CN17_MYCRO|nr:hypothetical protein B0H17DRAFT_1146828 [Mycena rosella]
MPAPHSRPWNSRVNFLKYLASGSLVDQHTNNLGSLGSSLSVVARWSLSRLTLVPKAAVLLPNLPAFVAYSESCMHDIEVALVFLNPLNERRVVRDSAESWRKYLPRGIPEEALEVEGSERMDEKKLSSVLF